MQQNKLNNLYIIGGNNTISNKNSIYVSIVFGATLRTTAYQPNPVYIKEGQAITWTNNDNNIDTVTQRDYINLADNQKILLLHHHLIQGY